MARLLLDRDREGSLGINYFAEYKPLTSEVLKGVGMDWLQVLAGQS
jgi:hypothetical protein